MGGEEEADELGGTKRREMIETTRRLKEAFIFPPCRKTNDFQSAALSLSLFIFHQF